SSLGTGVAHGRRVARLLVEEARLPRRVARSPCQGRPPRGGVGRGSDGFRLSRSPRRTCVARARARAVVARSAVPRMIAPLLAPLTCAATAIHYEPLPQSGSLRGIPWVQGTPLRRGFFGVLFAYDAELGPSFALYTHGESPHGHIEKILWIV